MTDTPSLLQMTAPLREDFDIPYHDIGPKNAPARVALVAGIHGNELNGVFVLSRLAAFLNATACGEQPGVELRERVIVIPAVNVLGLNTLSRRWPFDGTDINRMFPGYNAGETTQRIAHAVLEVTRPASYRVDLHSSNLEFEELPQIRLYAPTEAERLTARCFGMPAIIERPMNSVFTSTIGHAWRESGGQNFVIQAGQAGVLQPQHCERVFAALVRLLQHVEALVGAPLSTDDADVHYFGVDQTAPLISAHAGIFVSRLEVGRWVRSGEVIGQVYDSFNGELRIEIRSPVSGLLSGLRRQPLLCEGDLIARIETRQPVPSGVDTYLHGQGQ
ncbi:MAG: succinylglutamate desuccinylase/aspartoacylase family protein [Deltaproteobacteria bacterium]|nr:succinylglutamate desuccinylase/aspartoacylase family protein [Deltaproteobacteria bacterium]